MRAKYCDICKNTLMPNDQFTGTLNGEVYTICHRCNQAIRNFIQDLSYDADNKMNEIIDREQEERVIL